jgi:peptidoglycan hydrolase CwlO-like protein
MEPIKKPVEIWQLVIGIVAVLVSVITFTSMATESIKDAAAKSAASSENHEIRIKQLEFDRTETKQDIKDMKSDIRETLLILRDKADRK